MSNQFLTISDITKESLRVLKNTLVFARSVNRSYDSRFGKSGAKIGATVNARKPPRYVGRTGAAINVEAMTETYVPVTLSTQFGVDVAATSADRLLNINDFSEMFIKPAMAAIANKVDYDGLQLYKKVPNVAGTLGQITGGSLTQAQGTRAIMAAHVKLDNEAALGNERRALWTPGSSAEIVTAFSGLFNPSQAISQIFREGALGDNILRANHAASQNVPVHTTGSATNSNLSVNGAHAGGTVQTDATTGYTVSIANASSTVTLKAGDVITFDTVYAVNPQSRQSTGQLRQFVVLADASLTGSTNTDISIWPYPVFSGQFQNVTSVTGTIPASADLTQVTGVSSASYDQNLIYHPDAFVLATADLELPQGVDQADMARAADAGLSVRVISQYDIRTDQFIMRTDVLYGWAAVYPELACRITG